MQDITKPAVDITQPDSYATNAPDPEPGEPISNAFRGIHVADHLRDWSKDEDE
jgi:hypothetical protein